MTVFLKLNKEDEITLIKVKHGIAMNVDTQT